MKLDTQGYSKLIILNSTILFLNFIPKIPFLDGSGPETSKSFVWNENPYKEVPRGADSNKLLDGLESTPFNTPLYRDSFQTKHFEYLGPN